MKIEMYKNMVFNQISQQGNSPQNIKTKLSHKEVSESKMLRPKNETLKKILEDFQEFLSQFNLDARIVYNKKYDTLVVQVFRRDTGELIKQIPPEELLEISKRLQELVGILLKERS